MMDGIWKYRVRWDHPGGVSRLRRGLMTEAKEREKEGKRVKVVRNEMQDNESVVHERQGKKMFQR